MKLYLNHVSILSVALSALCACGVAVRPGGPGAPDVVVTGDVPQPQPLGRVEFVFSGYRPDSSRFTLATLSAAVAASGEYARSPLMVPGSMCAIERVGTCRVYTRCGLVGAVPNLSAGNLTAVNGATTIRLDFMGTGYGLSGRNLEAALDPAITVSGTGSGVSDWRYTGPTPVLAEFSGVPVANVARAMGLRLTVLPRQRPLDPPIVLLGNSSGPMILCTYDRDAVILDVPAEVLLRLSEGNNTLASGTLSENPINAGARSFTVAIMLLSATSNVNLL